LNINNNININGGNFMKKVFEITFTETVRSKCYIDAKSLDEAQDLFMNGEYSNAKEIEVLDYEIEKAKEA
jgi:effector-binding domain-containing protein